MMVVIRGPRRNKYRFFHEDDGKKLTNHLTIVVHVNRMLRLGGRAIFPSFVNQGILVHLIEGNVHRNRLFPWTSYWHAVGLSGNVGVLGYVFLSGSRSRTSSRVGLLGRNGQSTRSDAGDVAGMHFVKMHGAGNDYIYVDCFSQRPSGDVGELARKMSHRRFGVGADGLILICPSEKADARMQMFNADGSEAEMCGNGIRCVAKFLYERRGVHKSEMIIETKAGLLTVWPLVHEGRVDRVRVDMGEPILEADRIPSRFVVSPVVNQPLEVAGMQLTVTCVSMGNPHCVVFVPEATDYWVLQVGPKIETHRLFPARTNVEFVEVLSDTEVRQRTWERGSGETWACGTGASAVCVAGVLTGRTARRIVNHLLGGDLELEWRASDNHVYMTGPAQEVFEGHWPG